MSVSEVRSRTMRAVKSTNTKPEVAVRKLAHSLGFRFRLHVKNLPGSPDMVFASKRCVIFINGCFWHGHDCKRGSRKPRANADYWENKILKNRERDSRVAKMLEVSGWKILTIWECEIRSMDLLREKLWNYLSTNGHLSHTPGAPA